MALTSTANFKTFAGITVATYDTLIGQLITRAQSAIEGYCNRVFDSASYREYYDGEGTSELILTQYPVTAINLLSTGRTAALSIMNTSSDAYNAFITVTETTLQLVVQGGTNADNSSLTLATYTTMPLLVAAITALAKGWTVQQYTELSYWAASELLPTGKGKHCLNDYADLELPDEPEVDFSVDAAAGILKLWGIFPTGHQNITVRYTAGYSTIPNDLEQICIDLTKLYYDNASINSAVQSESIGDYSYTNKDSGISGGFLPKDIRQRLDRWRTHVV